VALIVAVIGMPFVLLYTAGVYWIFRGKATVDKGGY
jgi:cytochrome bd-type quinol oxidase subunit 2